MHVIFFLSKLTSKGREGFKCPTLLTLMGHLPIFKYWASNCQYQGKVYFFFLIQICHAGKEWTGDGRKSLV
jgi:hypothetical protein